MVETKSLDQLRVRVSYLSRALDKNKVKDREWLEILEKFNNYEKWTTEDVQLMDEGT